MFWMGGGVQSVRAVAVALAVEEESLPGVVAVAGSEVGVAQSL